MLPDRKKKLEEEGLFITEFNEEFFEQNFKANKDIENVIEEIVDLSKKSKKKYEEACKKEGATTILAFGFSALI